MAHFLSGGACMEKQTLFLHNERDMWPFRPGDPELSVIKGTRYLARSHRYWYIRVRPSLRTHEEADKKAYPGRISDKNTLPSIGDGEDATPSRAQQSSLL
jgi:hypothetical protein